MGGCGIPVEHDPGSDAALAKMINQKHEIK